MKKLQSLILLLVIGYVAVGISFAANVQATAEVKSVMSWTPPHGGAFPAKLDPSVDQPQKMGDSFIAGCNGPFEVVAESDDSWPLAATGKMVEWDLSLINPDGHILGTPMHLVGADIGDKNLGAILVKLVESDGQAPKTYNFDWSQTTLWSDYPEKPYTLTVKFNLNPIIT